MNAEKNTEYGDYVTQTFRKTNEAIASEHFDMLAKSLPEKALSKSKPDSDTG